MNNNPEISVIMSVYNGEAHLRESIESILNQTFKNFEFIIIDDASIDSSLQIIQSYQANDNRIILVRNEKNLGLTKSLNKALTIAKGKFVARQDADDLSLDTRLEKQYKLFIENPDIILISSSASIMDSKGNEIHPKHYKLSPEQIGKYLKRQNIIVHGSVMFRKNEIIELGGYREQFKYAQDYDLWLRIIDKQNIYILPEYLYKVRISLENLSIRNFILQEEFAKIAKMFYCERKKFGKDSYENYFKDFSLDNIQIESNRAKAKYHFLKAMYLLGEDKIFQLRKELLISIKYYPFNLKSYFYLLISLFGLRGINILRKVRDTLYMF